MKHKILFISSWFPNKLEPTNGNFVQRHAEASALYNDVEVLHAVGDFNQEELFLFDDKIINDLRTLIVYYKNSHIPALNFFRRMSAYKKGFAKLSVPDLIHGNVHHNSMLFAVYLKKKHKIPFVISEHWTAFRILNKTQTSRTSKIILKFIGNNSSAIFPVSEDLKLGLQNLGITTAMVVVPNSVDLELFIAKQQYNQTFEFLHISDLSERKNTEKILKISLKLLDAGFQFKIKIGGDGVLKKIASLQTIANNSKYFNNIEIFGIQTLPQVADKMRNTDCFILFSDDENQPCVIAEAFASGIPVISANVGGISEFFPEGFGILIDKPDVDSLKKAMIDILNNKTSFASAEEISTYAKNTFSKEVIGKKFTEVYDEVLR